MTDQDWRTIALNYVSQLSDRERQRFLDALPGVRQEARHAAFAEFADQAFARTDQGLHTVDDFITEHVDHTKGTDA